MKYAILLTIAAMLLAPASAFAAGGDFTVNYPLYTLKVPAGFMTENSTVMAFGPDQSTNFNVVISPEPKMNLEEYTKYSKEQIKDIPDFKIEKEGSETYNGVKFATALNRFKREDMNLRSKGAWTISDKKAYVLTFTSADTTYDKYIKEGEELFKGFNLAGPELSVPAAFVPENSVFMVFGAMSGDFRVNYNVIVRPEKDRNLEQYTEFSKQEVKNIPGFVIEKEGYETLGGEKFYSMVSKFSQNGLPLKAKSVWTIKNGKSYILTYTSTEAAFDKYAKDADAIAASFKIK